MRYSRELQLFDHYNRNSEYYSPINSQREVESFLDRFHIAPSVHYKVLDVGCGDGRLARWWKSADITGVDVSPVRIEKARRTAVGTFYCEDIYDYLESETDRYDLGIAVEILEHLENPQYVIQMMREHCSRVIGTLPVNMPYVAHLDVYVDEADVMAKLAPDKVRQDGEHFYCEWTGL